MTSSASRTPFSLDLSSLDYVRTPVFPGSPGLSLRPPGSTVSSLRLFMLQAACRHTSCMPQDGVSLSWGTPCPGEAGPWGAVSAGLPAALPESFQGLPSSALLPPVSGVGCVLLLVPLLTRPVCVSQARPGFAQLHAARLSARPPVSASMLGSGSYSRGLVRAQAVLELALADSTRSRQDTAAAEFRDWLSVNGGGVGLSDAGPEDLLVYVEEWWLPNHPGRKRAEAGPQAVKGLLSSLSGRFTRAGRVGAYDSATRAGNPCECPWVQDYRSSGLLASPAAWGVSRGLRCAPLGG